MNDLGKRMKGYEQSSQTVLTGRMPTIIRLDGKAFHTYTKGFKKPFDGELHGTICVLAKFLCQEIQNSVFAYTQSDEISILLHPYRKLDTCPWFGNEVQKMTSVSAGLASGWFNLWNTKRDMRLELSDDGGFVSYESVMNILNTAKIQVFDSRVFVLPEAEVTNYFLWRQQDCKRNSIQLLGQSLYSHKQLDKKNSSDIQEMCFQKGQNWNDLDIWKKRGSAIYKTIQPSNLYIGEILLNRWDWFIDQNIPIFSQDRNFIEQHLKVEQE